MNGTQQRAHRRTQAERSYSWRKLTYWLLMTTGLFLAVMAQPLGKNSNWCVLGFMIFVLSLGRLGYVAGKREEWIVKKMGKLQKRED